MGIIDVAFENSNYQLSNFWEFYISKNNNEDWPLVAKVKSTSLPFIKLSSETRKTGEKAYTGFIPTDNFTIDVYETTEFSSYNYFKEWMDSIFDEINGTFISMPAGVEKGSPQDLIHRTGFLTFESFRVNSQKIKNIFVKEITKGLNDPFSINAIKAAVDSTIIQKEYSFIQTKTIVTKEIVDNILLSLGRGVVNRVVDLGNTAASIVNRATGKPTLSKKNYSSPPVKESYNIEKTPLKFRVSPQKIESIKETIKKEILREKEYLFEAIPTKTFKYEGLKILGLSEMSLDYDNTRALQFSVDLIADRVVPLN